MARLKNIGPALLFSLGAMLVWLIYQQGVEGPWIFDDFPNLQPLLDSRDVGWAALLDQFLVSPSGRLGRPVSMLSFIFSAMVSGENLAGWKEVNVFLHLLTGGAFFWVSRRLLEDLGGWESRQAAYGAALVSLLWLLHPLHVSTVLYTVQRMAILPALFCALGLGFYLSGRRALVENRGGWPRVFAAIFLFWPLAALSKENGALLGLYIVFLEALMVPLGNELQRKRLKALLAVTVMLPLGAAVVYAIAEPAWVVSGYALRDFNLYERVLTEARVVWGYIFWLLVPLQRNLGFMHDDVVVSTALTTPLSTLPALLGWGLVIPFLWMMRRRTPLIVAGLGLFLVGQLLESTIVPLELVFEHRTYFGSFGILLALAALLSHGLRQPLLRYLSGASVLLVLLALSVMRIQSWSDINHLYPAMWRAHPQSPRLVTTFAAQFARNGQFENALSVLKGSQDSRTDIARLYVYCLRDAALSNEVLQGVATQPVSRLTDYYMSALVAVSLLGLEGNCQFDHQQFADLYGRAINKKNTGGFERYKLLIYQAHHLHRAGNLMQALSVLDEASLLSPQAPVPLSLKTEWLVGAGRIAEAEEMYLKLEILVEASKIEFSDRMLELERLLAEAEKRG